MKCVRCGSEMKEVDRCCLKCGAINYKHPLNEKFAKEYALQSEIIKANPKLLKGNVKILYLLIFLLLIGIIIFLTIKFIG